MAFTSLIVKGYSLINNSGFLESAWGRRQFARAYFLGKQHLDPVYAKLIRKYPELFRGGHIIDVGANIGYMASLFASAADRQFKVYAFEPEPANFSMLVDTIKAGKYRDQVVPIQAAVGQQDGVVELWSSPICLGDRRVVTPEFKAALPGSESDLVSVPIVSIDSFLDREQSHPLSFVKMRVQGYEVPVCLGMQRTLDSNPYMNVAMTFAPDYLEALGYEPTELIELFESRQYKFYAVDDRGKLCPLPKPKPGIPDLLNSSTSFVKTHLPLPDTKSQHAGPGRGVYLELLLTRKQLAL